VNGHSVAELRQDNIMNSINHVFGHHEECASYFCLKNKTDIADYIEKIKSMDQEFYANVMKHIRNLQFGEQLYTLLADAGHPL